MSYQQGKDKRAVRKAEEEVVQAFFSGVKTSSHQLRCTMVCVAGHMGRDPEGRTGGWVKIRQGGDLLARISGALKWVSLAMFTQCALRQLNAQTQ